MYVSLGTVPLKDILTFNRLIVQYNLQIDWSIFIDQQAAIIFKFKDVSMFYYSLTIPSKLIYIMKHRTWKTFTAIKNYHS